jgi:hypothetical protein
MREAQHHHHRRRRHAAPPADEVDAAAPPGNQQLAAPGPHGPHPSLRRVEGQPAGVSAWRTASLQGNAAMARLNSPTPAPTVPTSGGSPLPEALRARFEAAFGHDFAHVRVHAGADAASAAVAVQAEAFAVGSHLYFAAGQYAPGTPAGERLLAHELTHVVQHDERRLPSTGGVSDPGDPAEREAYHNEATVLAALGPAEPPAILPPPASPASPAPDAPSPNATVHRSEAPLLPDPASFMCPVPSEATEPFVGPVQADATEPFVGPVQPPPPACPARSTRPEPAPRESVDRSTWTDAEKAAEIELLTDRIVTLLADHETNQVQQESDLGTSAGVAASYESRLQLTTGRAITDLLRADATLRATLGMPDVPGTLTALRAARDRAVAMGRLYEAVRTSNHPNAQAAYRALQASCDAAGITADDLTHLLRFRDFRKGIAGLEAQLEQAEAAALLAGPPEDLWAAMTTAEQEAFPMADWPEHDDRRLAAAAAVAARRVQPKQVQLAIRADSVDFPHEAELVARVGRSSLGTYAGKNVWAEDKVAWERVAVERMGTTIGGRTVGAAIEHAAELDEGLALGRHTVREVVVRTLTDRPAASHYDVVYAAAKAHNGAGYATERVSEYLAAVRRQSLVARPLANGRSSLPCQPPGSDPFAPPQPDPPTRCADGP